MQDGHRVAVVGVTGAVVAIQPVKPGLFAGVDLVLASAGSFVTAQIAQEVVDAGAVLIANPNCNAAILSPVLAGRPHENSVIPYQYAFNVFLHNTELMDNGYVTEEWKVISELRKILGEPALPVNVHSVRVPVMRSHAEVVNVELAGTPSVEELYALLGAAPGVAVYGTDGWDEHGLGPTPVAAAHTDDVLVGRIRRDHTADNRYDIWLTGDQLRKGAALNAVQIAETLLPVSACCV